MADTLCVHCLVNCCRFRSDKRGKARFLERVISLERLLKESLDLDRALLRICFFAPACSPRCAGEAELVFRYEADALGD